MANPSAPQAPPPPPAPEPQPPPPRQRGPTASRLPNCCHRCGLTFPSRNKLMRHFFPTSPSTRVCQGGGGKPTSPVPATPTADPPPPSADPPLPEPPLTTAQLHQMKAELQGLLARVDELLAKRAAAEGDAGASVTTVLDVEVGKETTPATAAAVEDSPDHQRKGEEDLTPRAPGPGPAPAQAPGPRNQGGTKASPLSSAAVKQRHGGGSGGSSSSSDDDTDDPDDDGCRINPSSSK